MNMAPGLRGVAMMWAAAQLSSQVETVKTNGQEPHVWLCHALERLPAAASVEDYEALLPLNCSPISLS
jgi:hypothetical protein